MSGNGWQTAPLREVVEAVLDFRGRTPKKLGMDWGGGDIPALSAVNVRAGGLDLDRTPHFGSDALYDRWMTQGDTAKGDVLITTEAPLGNVAQIPDDRKYILSQRVILLKPRRDVVDPTFLAQQMRGSVFQSLLDDHRSGTTATGIRQSRLITVPIHFPPLAEQRRILAQLESHQGRISRARTALDAVPPLLEKLRQSILAAAFRGDLTKDWRAKHKDVAPASELLKRIRVERRKKWEEGELAKMAAKGKVPRTNTYKEAAALDQKTMPALPRTWVWSGLSEIASLQLGQRRAPEYAKELEYPYLRAANITWDGLDLSDVKTMGFANPESVSLRPGDVLLSEASGSPSEVGKPALWQGELPMCCFQATLLRVRSSTERVGGQWLHLAFLKNAVVGDFAAMAPGIGILHLTAERMRAWPVPIAPTDEQEEILKIVGRSLAWITSAERSTTETRGRLAEFDKSVLAEAFRGDLLARDVDGANTLGDGDRNNQTRTSPRVAESLERASERP